MPTNQINNSANAVDADLLRLAMRRFASGVTVVTSMGADGPTGITVSAFYSVSLAPPVVMISVNTESSVIEAIGTSGSFAVHILADEHSRLSNQFAESTDWDIKVRDYDWSPGKTGSPIIRDIPTVLEATTVQSVSIGTHEVIFGLVEHVSMAETPPSTPLLYYDRNYRTLDPIDRADSDAPR